MFLIAIFHSYSCAFFSCFTLLFIFPLAAPFPFDVCMLALFIDLLQQQADYVLPTRKTIATKRQRLRI